MLDNTLYTTMKVYNHDIDFHISMERYLMYVTDSIYKKYLESDPKKEPSMLYSLDQIGINRASLINKTIIVKTDSSSENEIKEINIFRTRKFTNASESTKSRMGYASEDAEIGFNIVRGSQYQYVEETENDIDTEQMKEDYQNDQEREKAYEEMYGLKNKSKNDSINNGYDPTHEYNPYDDENNDYRPYDDEEMEDMYEDYHKTNNKSNNNNGNNNNGKTENKDSNRERYIYRLSDGIF
jgi:hypothetical protein